ncbi:MAG TPA: iron chelate uptake ABC transporter family permease subunit [Gemmatimonadales bacterium]
MSEMLPLMIPPFVACMVFVAMLGYLGVHIIARGVIFVDLALAQMAALGGTAALLVGLDGGSVGGYAFAFGFATIGALLFAVTRTTAGKPRVPHEAIIGIVYVVASAATLLVADKAPHGAETIKEALAGTILWVTWPQIARLALVYVVIGGFHWLLRRRFFTLSLEEATALAEGWRVRWWDFLFYFSFGVAITLAVPIAGVLLVFTFLVVPAAIAFLFTRNVRPLIAVSWLSAAVASAAGLAVSFRFDLPTGPVIVCAFGMVLLAAGVARGLVRPRSA